MVWALLFQYCVVKVTDNVIAKKTYIFPVKTLHIFAGNVIFQINYEPIVDRGGPRLNPFVKEVLGKHFINSISLSKSLAILCHKQTYNGFHF